LFFASSRSVPPSLPQHKPSIHSPLHTAIPPEAFFFCLRSLFDPKSAEKKPEGSYIFLRGRGRVFFPPCRENTRVRAQTPTNIPSHHPTDPAHCRVCACARARRGSSSSRTQSGCHTNAFFPRPLALPLPKKHTPAPLYIQTRAPQRSRSGPPFPLCSVCVYKQKCPRKPAAFCIPLCALGELFVTRLVLSPFI
jgi:hypothetical protein